MLDVEMQTEVLASGLAGIPEDQIRAVVEAIARICPDFNNDAAFDTVRIEVLAVLEGNISLFKYEGFVHYMIAKLDLAGALSPNPYPEDMEIDPVTLERLNNLGTLHEMYRLTPEKVAYLILHSKTKSEVEKVCTAGDDTQILLPFLHGLIERDPSIENRIREELGDYRAAKAASEIEVDLFASYFKNGNAQPLAVLYCDYGDEDFVKDKSLKEFHEAFIKLTLKVLQEYLEG